MMPRMAARGMEVAFCPRETPPTKTTASRPAIGQREIIFVVVQVLTFTQDGNEGEQEECPFPGLGSTVLVWGCW
jgi:hypothetical protein